MADDLIDEWKRAAASPAPAAGPARAAKPAHGSGDLIDEWARTLPPRLQGAAGGEGAAVAAAPSPENYYLEQARNDPVIRLARESHGHGNRSITDLVTGKRPDSYLDKIGHGAAGFGRGTQIVGGTLAQGLSYAGEPLAEWAAERGLISPDTARRTKGWHEDVNAMVAAYRRAWEEANAGTVGEVGSIAGQIASTGPALRASGWLAGRFGAAPVVSRVAAPVTNWAARNPGWAAVPRGAATGAIANVLTSSASDDPLSTQAGWGAAGGAALGPIGYGLGRLFTGAVDRETADLAKLALDKYKIPIRVDQISANPMARFGGSVAQRTPGTGLAANVAEQQGAFNQAVANTFGENADKITPTVMAAAKSRIGNVFDTMLPKLEAHLNPNVSRRLNDITNALPYLPAEDARIVARLKDDIVGQFSKTAIAKALASSRGAPKSTPVSGNQIQALITKGSPLDRAMEGGSSNVRYYAGQLKNLLLDAVEQTATGRAKRAAGYVQALQGFQRARYQYKNMKTIEDLAEKATTGDISPALLMGQVRQSFGNMAYGGGGDLADLARIGQRFLKEPPSSGTAERLTAINLALGGAAGLGGIAAFDPEHIQRDAAILGATLLGARMGGGVLKSRSLARAAVRSGHRTTPPALPVALTSKLPFFAPRHNPLTLPVAAPDQNR